METQSDRTSETQNIQSGAQMEAPSFASLGLPEALQRGLSGAGMKEPTQIQALAIPHGLAGCDVLASAQTGTGKTAAFMVPALNKLLRKKVLPEDDTGSTRRGKGPQNGPRVLVLTPTRELAGQVEGVARQLAAHTKLRMGQVVGGVAYGPQERLLRGQLDLLVATPGRLIDHMEQGTVDLSHVEIFVLDEADRMLDLGFVKPVKRIAAAIPNKRQTLLFSATLEGQVMAIAKQLLRDPVEVRLASTRERHAGIEQRMHNVRDAGQKHAMLAHLLKDPELTQAIVFTATKRGADRLAKRLKTEGHACAALHGNMRQNARDRTVDLLRRGKVQILVATDVAARGIDLLGVSHVINFDLPQVAEDYIHRIGRTGRNGATGIAVSLVAPVDLAKLGQIERLTGYRFQGKPVPAHVAEHAPATGRSGAMGGGAATSRGAPQQPGRVERPERNSRRRGKSANGNQNTADGQQPKRHGAFKAQSWASAPGGGRSRPKRRAASGW